MINLVIIGAGYISKEHLKVIKTIKEFNLTGIYSRTFSKAQILSKQFKIKNTYKSISEMFYNEKPDAVAVFVSAENMYKVLSQVIKYKTPVFFEKPAGLTFKETKKLYELSIKYKTKNMVGLNRRFYSVFNKGINFLKKNGGISGFLVEGHERFWKINNSINKKVYRNWVYSNGVHTIDLLRFFGGEVKNFKSFSNHKGSFKNFTIAVKFKNNLIGTYISNWNSPGGWSVTLFGKGYTVVFKPLEKGFIIDKKFKMKEIEPEKYDRKYKPGFYKQLIFFKKLVLSGRLQNPAQNLGGLINTTKIIRDI